jgi:hypothetical protein
MGKVYPRAPYFEADDLEKQNQWFNEYRIDSIRLGRMCREFPGLQKSWEQFKITYELCKSQDDINRQIPPDAR